MVYISYDHNTSSAGEKSKKSFQVSDVYPRMYHPHVIDDNVGNAGQGNLLTFIDNMELWVILNVSGVAITSRNSAFMIAQLITQNASMDADKSTSGGS
jgi:hypothetical protein